MGDVPVDGVVELPPVPVPVPVPVLPEPVPVPVPGVVEGAAGSAGRRSHAASVLPMTISAATSAVRAVWG
jgi:hypothetical protein